MFHNMPQGAKTPNPVQSILVSGSFAGNGVRLEKHDSIQPFLKGNYINLILSLDDTWSMWNGGITPPKFNIDPEKWWVEDDFPIGTVTFQGLC